MSSIKKAIKKAAKFIVGLPIFIKFISILIIGTLFLTIADEIIEIFTAKSNPENMYSTFDVENVEELVEIKESEDGSGYYLDFVDDFDEKVEKIINEANNSLGLHNLPKDKEFIKKIIKAEVVTQFPDLGGNIPENSDGFQGAIDIRRVTPNKEIGSIDDNPGRGETTTIEQEEIYDTEEATTANEETVKSWAQGQKLIIKGKATVYEQDESLIDPGSDTGHWHEKVKDQVLYEYVTIADGTEVTYTGTYKTNKNKITGEMVVYVEVEKSDGEKVFVRSINLMEKQSESKQEENEVQKMEKGEDKAVTSRAKENDKAKKTAGKEGETYTIAIAAGHNNTDDTGARNGSLKEEELTIETAEKVEELLSEYSNITVVQTGSTSENPGGIQKEDRKSLAREANPDLCIQIYFDSGGGSGIQAIYKEGDGISQQLAEFLLASMYETMGLPNNGAGQDVDRCAGGSLGIIENAATSGFPSVVTKGGFIDGESDATLLKEEGTEPYATGIVNGILEYLKADHNGYTATSIERESTQESIESKVYNLKYVTPDKLGELLSDANNGNHDAQQQVLKVYTLDDDRNLVTTSWEMKEEGKIEYKKNAAMSFRTSLQNYIMPYEYLLYFYIDTNKKDFSEQLADEVLDTEIVIAVQDNITTIKTTEVTTETKVASIKGQGYKKKISENTTITETCTPKIEITYADAWCVKYYKENSYSSKALDWQEGEEEKILNIKGKVTETPSSSSTGNKQIGDVQKGEAVVGTETTPYTYRIYQKTDTTQNTMSIEYDSGDATTKGNENKFIKLYLENDMQNWVRTSKLFNIIEKNEKTANLLDLTKYLIYEATGKAYDDKYEYAFTEFNLGAFSGVSEIYGGTIQEKVWFALKDLGYRDEVVAGAMGNIDLESGGFKAGAVEKEGTGIGLIQWSKGRADNLRAYATHKGVDWTDEDTQVEFLITEISGQGAAEGFANHRTSGYIGDEKITGTCKQWEEATTVEDATLYFMRYFESPAHKNTYDQSGTWR